MGFEPTTLRDLVGFLSHISIDPLLVLIEFVPYGDLLGYLRKSRGLNDTYFKDPDVKPQTSLTAEQLIRFAWQVADGMLYLSSRKVWLLCFIFNLIIHLVKPFSFSRLVRSSPDRSVPFRALAVNIGLYSHARLCTLIVPHSIQVYKWVLANLMLGLIQRWSIIPSKEE